MYSQKRPNSRGQVSLENFERFTPAAGGKHNYRMHVAGRANSTVSVSWGSVAGILFFLALFLIPLLLFLLGAGFYGYYQVSGRIIPGISVGNSEIGGMLITDAALQLEKTWNLDNQIVLTNGIQSITIKPVDLGLRLDALATVEAAYQIGHQDSLVDRIGHLLIGFTQGWPIHPIIVFDENQARAGLEQITPQLSLPARNASIRVEGETLVAVSGEIGYTINLDDTLSILNSNPTSVLQNRILQIPLAPVSPQVSDLTPILAQAEDLLNQPASFQAYDALKNEMHSFQIPKETLVNWLTLEIQDQTPQISLDKTKIKISLHEWEASLGEGRFFEAEKVSSQIADTLRERQIATVLISHAPSLYEVKPGDTLLIVGWNLGMPFWKIIEANPGIDPDRLMIGSTLVIPSKDELLPLPVVFNKRILISIKKQRLWVYQDGKLVSEHLISTGIDRSPTQPGVFQIQTHEKNAYASVWNLHMPNFLGIYEAWPGFMNGIHGLPTLANGQRLWANILGKPASYGCIILNLQDAKWLYDWAEAGVVVEITP